MDELKFAANDLVGLERNDHPRKYVIIGKKRDENSAIRLFELKQFKNYFLTDDGQWWCTYFSATQQLHL